eukprot:7253698-Prymnesium_polylepis.1
MEAFVKNPDIKSIHPRRQQRRESAHMLELVCRQPDESSKQRVNRPRALNLHDFPIGCEVLVPRQHDNGATFET